MPKDTSTAETPDVKPDPYPKESPSKKSTSSNKNVFTEEMDRKIIHHVLKKSDISLRYDWPELVQNEFPGMTTKQLKGRWEYKLRDSVFPPGVLKLSKQAKEKGA